MKSGPAQFLADQARSIANAFNVLVLLAAPKVCARVLARGATLPSPHHIAEHLEELIGALDGATFGRTVARSGSDVLPTLRAVQRIALEGDGKGVAPELREGARLALEVLDYPEPPGGWDLFEGPAEDET